MSDTVQVEVVKEVIQAKPEDRTAQAESLVRKSVCAAAGVGILPLPLIDLAAFNGIQLNMLYRLSKVYEVPFSRDVAKGMIGMLVSGSGAALLTVPTWSLLKAIPVVGTVIGGVTVSTLAAATTYALGKVFIQHFESGGTFLTFDPKAVRARFAQLQEEGKKVAQEAAAPAK